MVPRIAPPGAPPASPLDESLRPGAHLYRVHATRFAANEFNATIPSAVSGGRFDSPVGEYAHLYACSSPEAAIAEALLRIVPYGDAPRQLPRAHIADLVISRLTVRAEVPLAALHGPRVPGCAGLVWRPRHANDDLAYVFFSDRIGSDALEVASRPLPLDSGDGLVLLRRVLRSHGVVVGPAAG